MSRVTRDAAAAPFPAPGRSGQNPRVLIVAHAFPPSPAIGAQRPWGLYRHLRECGWEPRVLTASAGDQLPGVIRVPHRRPGERVREWLGLPANSPGAPGRALRSLRRRLAEVSALPDDERGWLSPALAKVLDPAHWGEGFDAVVSTSLPVTAHVLAARLKERTGVPWLADLRDLWADNYFYPWGAWRRSYDRRVEKRVLAAADALVTVSEPLAQALRERHSKDVAAIPNGFPAEDLAHAGIRLTRSFSITYTGSIYAGKQDPTPLFAALSRLLQEAEGGPMSFEVRFYGQNVEQAWLRRAIASHGLESHVTLGAMLPRHESVARQRESQMLLALDWMDERQPGVYTGKIFEYLAAQRPIVSIGPPGSVVDTLLQGTRAGCQFQGGASLCEFLFQSYVAFRKQGHVPYFGDQASIEAYSHARMARHFARELNNIAAR